MKHPVISFIIGQDGESASGSVELNPSVFGLTPRVDIIQRMVVYQLAKRRAGTHVVKNRALISGSNAKWGRQKGGGRARHGSRKANVFRGGGKAHGPVARSHAIDMPKKLRALALRHALSEKLRQQQLVVVREISMEAPKTASLRAHLEKHGLENVLIVDAEAPERNFALSARNLPKVSLLPVAGINVYDILRRDNLVLTEAAVTSLEARLA